MIVLNLRCEHGHAFEGWFASAEKFAEQRDSARVTCPVCCSAQVDKLPSAPAIASLGSRSGSHHPFPAADDKKLVDLQRQALRLMRGLARGAVDVGERFPEEARRMHYGEAETRDIRGTASSDEVRALVDEGIPVLPLPAAAAEEGH